MKQKLTMIELFAGIGAQKRGIDNTGLYDLEVVATSDIDKDAVVEYAAIHHGLTKEMIESYDKYPSREKMAQSLMDRKIGLDFKTGEIYDWFKLAKKKNGMELEKFWLSAELANNMGDICGIDALPYSDVVTYSFPCTDISVAGELKGLSKKSGTRSGLLWEVERLLEVAKENSALPKYLLMENVDNLVSQKFKPDFDIWCNKLDELNYNTYWKILNAKEGGVPQNRRRVFALSIRKDIDTGKFTFPIPFDAGIRLKDILEQNVEEKYYINTERASNLIKQLIDKGRLPETNQNKTILVKNYGDDYEKDIDCAVTLLARDWKGWNNYGSTAIVESNAATNNPNRLGNMYGEDMGTGFAGNVWDKNAIAPALMTMQGGNRQPSIIEDNIQTNQNKNEENTYASNGVKYKDSIYRIRKLTPKECFKLMTFEFEDVDKCWAIGASNTALYRAAGNSIVTNCIQLLFEHLYKAQYDENYICTDEKMLNFQHQEVSNYAK